MNMFRQRRFLIPIEITIALAINVVVVTFGYYAVVLWGLISR
jgi:hypothetical protein